MIEIRRYTEADQAEWDRFVAQSRQGTFLFRRGYMDYHSDRFADHSLLVYNDGRLAALLPANENDGTLWSHQGLTYGGLLTGDGARAGSVCDMFAELNNHLRACGLRRVVYKPMPWIYQRIPSEEDLYALFNVCHARLLRRYISSSIIFSAAPRWQRLRRRCALSARENGLTVEQDNGALAEFWPILTRHLGEKYGVRPVHTLEEMLLLSGRFPEQIQLYVARKDGMAIGGILFYVAGQVLHPQYSSATADGDRLHALDAIYSEVLLHHHYGCTYFDFGNSNEDGGRYLNRNLIFEKEGWGGRGVCYDWYEYEL